MSVVRVPITKAEAEVAKTVLLSFVIDLTRNEGAEGVHMINLTAFLIETKNRLHGENASWEPHTSALFTLRGEAHGVAMREYGVNTFNPNDQGECAPDAPRGRMSWRIVPYKVSFERIEEKKR